MADDEKSVIRDDDQLISESSDKEDKEDKEDKPLKDKLESNIGKTIVRALSGEGLHFNRIKINENLLKKDILKVRYINSNRRVNNKLLKEDYQISNNMKNAI